MIAYRIHYISLSFPSGRWRSTASPTWSSTAWTAAAARSSPSPSCCSTASTGTGTCIYSRQGKEKRPDNWNFREDKRGSLMWSELGLLKAEGQSKQRGSRSLAENVRNRKPRDFRAPLGWDERRKVKCGEKVQRNISEPAADQSAQPSWDYWDTELRIQKWFSELLGRISACLLRMMNDSSS